MLRRPLPFFLLLLITGALAFAAGRHFSAVSEMPAEQARPLAESGSRISRILTIPDAAERAKRLVEAFSELDPADLPEVDQAFERSMTFVDPIAVVIFADWWTGFDPEGAFAATQKWPLNDPELGFTAVLRAWARRDPVSARLAFEGLDNPARRDAALRALAQGWAESGHEQGLSNYLANMEDGVGRQRGMQVLIATMVARDGIDAALEFAESIPDDAPNRFKLQIFRRVATAVTQVDPERGAAWAISKSEGRFGDSLLKKVATSWIRTDPSAAMEWVRALPEGTQRDMALRESFREWLMDDRPTALGWIKQAGVSPDLDPALELYASSIGRKDPLAGLQLAHRIENPELKERSVFNIGRAWFALDLEAASQWLETAPVSDPLKQRIRREAAKRRQNPPRQR